MYTVFARKYRPQRFNEVIGQEHCTTTLKNAVSKGTIAHAYLFAGPRGVGKTTTARILAKALNCESGPTPDPCNECTNCREITQGNSVDVIEIDGASNRGIDEIRTLRENARYVPGSSRYKIYIIDEVHMLTREAFNALLKTLEEPPPHVVFIFATTSPQKVPQTILSRCQRFNFRRILFEDIITTLQSIIEKEKIDIEDGALRLIAKKADGELRDAEGMLDQLVAYSDSQIKEEEVRNVLGLPDEEVFFDLLNYLNKGDTKSTLTLVQQLIESGVSAEELLTGLVEHLRSILLVKNKINSGMSEKEREKFNDFAQKLPSNIILRIMRLLLEALREMRYSENPDIYFMEIMARLASFKTVPIEDIIERLEETQEGLKTSAKSEIKEAHQVYPFTSPPDEKKEVTEKEDKSKQTLMDTWDKLVSALESEGKTLSSTLKVGKPLKMDEESLTVEFSSEYHRDCIKEKQSIVEDHLHKIIGKPLTILFKESKDERSKEDSVILNKALKIFSGEIISKGG